jgi:phage portal protein BeeE
LGLLERVAEARKGGPSEQRYAVDQYISDYVLPTTQFSYNGQVYPVGGVLQTQPHGPRIQEVTNSLPGYSAALRRCPPAFAAQMVRALVLSQARFTFRNRPSSPTPRRTFGTTALAPLEEPWPNATTGELLARMEWHAGLAGNAYVLRQPDRLRVLRPDWVAIVYGSRLEPDDPAHALDGEVIGYAYQQGGIQAGNSHPIKTLLPADVAHWSPLPDPESAALGMSWVTPALRDMQGDQAATEHKLNFFRNGATPNLVVKGIPAATKQQFDDIVDSLESKHTGLGNAYRTLYLTAGADATVVGSDLKQLDFRATQGAGETRIGLLSRVPAAILQIAEGLAGSSLNAGNLGVVRRLWADAWISPTLQDAAKALAPLIRVPADAELWPDMADMPILREDAKDAAEIEQIKQATIVAYVNGGFTPESAVAAVRGQDVSLLKHTGLLSVQLQPPGVTVQPAASAPPAIPPKNGKPPAPAPRS